MTAPVPERRLDDTTSDYADLVNAAMSNAPSIAPSMPGAMPQNATYVRTYGRTYVRDALTSPPEKPVLT